MESATYRHVEQPLYQSGALDEDWTFWHTTWVESRKPDDGAVQVVQNSLQLAYPCVAVFFCIGFGVVEQKYSQFVMHVCHDKTCDNTRSYMLMQ